MSFRIRSSHFRRLLTTTAPLPPALAVAAVASITFTGEPARAQQATTVPPVTVEVQRTKPKKRAATRRTAAPRVATAPASAAPFTPATPEGIAMLISATSIPAGEIAAKRASTSDTAALLSDVPGVSVYTAGGVSSLPVIQGLADDRLRIKVDGMDLIGSCPNHMNPALSYIDPNQVGSAKVWTGATPVSVGGDSIGGAIVVSSPDPVFAAPGQGTLTKGNVGAFYRSNGNVRGANLSATMATENVSVSYSGAFAKADNYTAGGNFKNFAISGIAPFVPANEVGSSAYETRNHLFGLAWRKENHLVEFKFGHQHIPYQLYPNQRMDMLDNKDYRFNLRYLGKFDWGNLEARAYHQIVDHYMDFGKDKLFWYGGLLGADGIFYPTPGMPMYTKSKTTGASAKADINLNARDLIRVGFDAQTYRLDDWWPPAPDCGVGNCTGGMAPLTFWNINNGQRDRVGVFGEWEAKWNQNWLSILGVRFERVRTDTGAVQGYNTTAMYTGSSVGTIGAFNAMDRSRDFGNVDLSAIIKHTPNANLTFELGGVRKTRAPNLYELYAWSTNTMAMEMNNFVGDGNGYVGNPFLKPETAYTASFTSAWHSTDRQMEIKLTPYYSHVENYIDAVRRPNSCGMMGCDNNPTLTNAFVKLTYANQTARLYGFDLSGKVPLGMTDFGAFGLKGVLSYTNGRNLVTGDGLYNIMPLNAKVMLTHKLGGWDNGIELVAVGNKYDISATRNELRTPGYSLVNLRSGYTWQKFRLSFGVENVLNQRYYLPLGGAYVGEGATMSFNQEAGTVQNTGLPPASHGARGNQTMWGTAVPGPGRSFYVAANMEL
jgi:iron complex outermembrane receptor protein